MSDSNWLQNVRQQLTSECEMWGSASSERSMYCACVRLCLWKMSKHKVEIVMKRISCRACVMNYNQSDGAGPSVCRVEHLDSHYTDFEKNWYLRLFRESVLKIQVSLNSDENNGHCTWRRLYLWQYLAEFFLEWEMLVRKSKHTFYVQ